MDRRDEKQLLNVMRTTEFDPAERLIRKNTKDRTILFVAAGQFMAFKDSENEIYKEGAILGVSEFLRDDEWKHDIICSQAGIIIRFSYDSLQDLTKIAPVTAIKMLRRIIRHQCYAYIYNRKLTEKKNFEFFHVDDEDLFIDLKLNFDNQKDREMATLFNKPPPQIKKGREFETMPFFLTEEFKMIIDDKVQKQSQATLKMSAKGDQLMSSGTIGGLSSANQGAAAGNSLYKSEFLKEKLNEQNEKRKRDRKNKKNTTQASVKTVSSANDKTELLRRRKEGQEDLEEVVDELKNDLQLIEDDYEQLKQSYAKLEAENKRLRELLDKERSDKQVIEVKLKKNAIHHELKDNQSLITNNTFFEAKRSKLASLNTTLLTTVRIFIWI